MKACKTVYNFFNVGRLIPFYLLFLGGFFLFPKYVNANDGIIDKDIWSSHAIEQASDLDLYLALESKIKDSEKVAFLYKAYALSKEKGWSEYSCSIGMDLSALDLEGHKLMTRFKYLMELDKSNLCGSNQQKGKLHNSIGTFFLDLEKSEDAIESFLKSVKYYAIDGQHYQTIPLGNISNAYFGKGQIEKAIQYSLEAIPHSEKLSEPERSYFLSNDYLRLVEMYASLDQLAKAETYLEKSISYLKTLEVKEYNEDYFRIYITAVDVFLQKGAVTTANQYLKIANNYVNEGNKEKYRFFQSKMAYEFINYDRAFKLVAQIDHHKIEKFEDKIDFLEFKKSILFHIANYEEAFKVIDEIRALEAKKFKENSVGALNMVDIEYELLKNKEKLAALNKQRAVDQGTIQKQRNSTIVIIGFAILLLFSVLSLYFKNKKVRETIRKEQLLKETLIQKNSEIELSREEALQASQAKQDFLSTMSHEIRTPMNAVLGLTNLLLDEMPRDNQMKHLQNIKFSGENLLSIINDVLDFSKIEAGKLSFSEDEFDLKQLLDNTIDALRYSRSKKEVEIFQKQKLGELDNLVIGDSTRLNQMLINLMGNAIKFTEEGYVSLETVVRENRGEEGIVIEFKIRDTGIGIPSDKLEYIFESFSQVENDRQDSLKGTGLGLAITKKLIDAQGGTLTVESKEGMGSIFTFTLPFTKGSPILVAQRSPSENKIFKEGLEGLRVLLVEDNAINQIVAVNTLKKLKLVPTVANHGVEALEIYAKQDFDLILMDIQMPLMNGIETTQNIRALEDASKNSIPIIALSADAYSNNVKVALDAGMNAYMTKPFKPEHLYETIRDNTRISRGAV